MNKNILLAVVAMSFAGAAYAAEPTSTPANNESKPVVEQQKPAKMVGHKKGKAGKKADKAG